MLSRVLPLYESYMYSVSTCVDQVFYVDLVLAKWICEAPTATTMATTVRRHGTMCRTSWEWDYLTVVPLPH